MNNAASLSGALNGTNPAYALGGLSAERIPLSGGDFPRMLERLAGPAEGESPRRPEIDKTSKLYEQCQELETFLLKTLITGMRNTIQKSGLIDSGFAGEYYEDMLYDEYAKDYARSAGLGLAETAYLELSGQRGMLVENRVSLEA
ncbi:MAG: rod-binding protein [Spirochaetaceae bacterium]|jgi:hypothetical protein|nr:rod-binding protein [Spirochaetaceae bacterium]